MPSMKHSVTRWLGKTIYRKCKCGETAFGAVYVGGDTPENRRFLYRCRNCNTIHLFNPPSFKLTTTSKGSPS